MLPGEATCKRNPWLPLFFAKPQLPIRAWNKFHDERRCELAQGRYYAALIVRLSKRKRQEIG